MQADVIFGWSLISKNSASSISHPVAEDKGKIHKTTITRGVHALID